MRVESRANITPSREIAGHLPRTPNKQHVIFEKNMLRKLDGQPKRELLPQRKEKLDVMLQQRQERILERRDTLKALRERERIERDRKLQAVREALRQVQTEMRSINHIPRTKTSEFKVKNDMRIDRGQHLAVQLNMALNKTGEIRHGLIEKTKNTLRRIERKVQLWKEKSSRVRTPRSAFAT